MPATFSIPPSDRSAPRDWRSESIDRAGRSPRTRPQSHAQPLLDEGPAGLPVVYTIDAGAYDIVVNGDHLLSWGVEPTEVQDAAMRNLAAWSATAAWTDEISGDRRLISSDTGNGWDAARILLPDVVAHLVAELGSFGRILIGLPERHLLTAGSLRPDDPDFAALFADFVVEQSGGADEPIDRRVFELVDGRLVEFAGSDPPRCADDQAAGDPAGASRPIRGRRTAIATITLDRPEALNALTIPMKTELLAGVAGRSRATGPCGRSC